MIGHGTSPFPPVRRCTTADKTLSNTSTCIYADDSQIYGFCRPLETVGLQDRVSACIGDVSLWMTVNWLQFNPSKTEVLWCSSPCHQPQIPTRPFRIGSTAILPVSSARVYISTFDRTSPGSLTSRRRNATIMFSGTALDS